MDKILQFKTYIYVVWLCACVALSACKPKALPEPKPMGYFRIDLPEHRYRLLDTTLQFKDGSTNVGAFLPSCSSSVTLPYARIKASEAFPRGIPTRLSHRAVPRATVVCVDVDPRLESRGSAGKTGFAGMD